jgi:Flp pilus assembly protein TadD
MTSEAMHACGAAVEPEEADTRQEVLQAAVAEELHVNGHYAESARLWVGLAGAGFQEQTSALRAAIAFYSAGDEASGDVWFRRARSAGTAPAELLYVEAQRAWAAGDLAGARVRFTRADALAPRASSHATNSLGALFWKLGYTRSARRCFRRALARDARDGLAATNLGRLALAQGRDTDAARLFAEAAAWTPHRAEAFVLYSRLLRRSGDAAGAREALVKARLRSAPPSEPARVVPALVTPRGHVRVRASVRRSGLAISARFELAPHAPQPPRWLGLNHGYAEISLAGRRGGSRLPLTERAGEASGHLRVVETPEDAWLGRFGGVRVLGVELAGLPIPPCVRLEEDWFELAGESGWLPLPLPAGPWTWELEVDLPTRFEGFYSTRETSSTGVGLIALRTPQRVEGDVGPGRGRLAVWGREDKSVLESAHAEVRSALSLWSDLVGPCRSWPSVLILNRPRSTFCYARPGFVRLASGVLSKSGQTAVIHHEMGHCWWGLGARFESGSAWLAEALAEFSLHLAEDRGLLPGQRQATLDALRALGGDALPSMSLAGLARKPGPEAAFVLRAKGGFLVSMLRQVIGSSTLRRTLRAVLEAGRERELDLNAFFAIAAWFHGATLTWFVNQWVRADAAMAFSVDDIKVRRRRDSLYEVGFRAASHGVATPGVPVEVSLALQSGIEQRVRVGLETGRAQVAVTTSTRPLALTIDPDSRWYATIERKTTRIES